MPTQAKAANDIHKNAGYDIRDDVDYIYQNLLRLGLTQYALELEIKGLTVVPAELVAPMSFTEQVREALLATYERRHGERLDYENAETLSAALGTPIGKHMAYMLLESPIFSDLLLNETILALVHYRVGLNATLSSFQALVKAKGGLPLQLHTDELLSPPPYGPHSGHCNATYALTDYTIDNGALCYLPGSHKYKRLPVGDEGWDQAVPVIAPAGSLIMWDGATWHGALPRKAKGLRLNIVADYIRPHLRPLEVFFDRLDDAAFAKYPPLYRVLLGESLKYWWKEEGPDFMGADWSKVGNSAYR